MALFGSSDAVHRYGVVIDIGSGSVLISIIHSDLTLAYPTVVWSHREHAPLRNSDSLEEASRAVMTALINVAMRLDAEGRKALYKYNQKAELKYMQCSISAPWSYTVTKTVNYKQDKSFRITEDIIDDLEHTIEKNIIDDLQSNDVMQNLGLQIITQVTTGLLANGYEVKDPVGQQAEQLVISHTSAVSQQYLIDSLLDLRDKLLPESKMQNISFILLYYFVVQEVLGTVRDACLVDITYEATEIGIVRDGVLTYATHTPFGAFSLARELANASGLPLHECFSHLHDEKPLSFFDTLSKRQRDDAEKAIDEYIARLADLFGETGDALSIPKRICLHADQKNEKLFADLIERAAKRNIKTTPAIVLVTSKLIDIAYALTDDTARVNAPVDTALLMSAQFFHKEGQQKKFKYS